MSLDEMVADMVARAVAERVVDVARPEFVTQRTAPAVFGMPKRDYLAHCRNGDWPSFADRRLRYSRTADIVGWLAAHPARAAVDDAHGSEFERSRSGVRRIA